jgi:hypothetical protein
MPEKNLGVWGETPITYTRRRLPTPNLFMNKIVFVASNAPENSIYTAIGIHEDS